MEHLETIIISDLHLGMGYSTETAEFSRQEEFFYDREFFYFIENLLSRSEKRKTKVELVLNGDILDFLSVTEVPSLKEQKKYGFNLGSSEKKYGLGSEEPKAIWKVKKIIKGHPLFFKALALFLYKGHEIVYLRGNHDLELYWKGVRGEIRLILNKHLMKFGSLDGSELNRFQIKPWFHIVGNELYIEHGHQYDKTNSITANLNPLLPKGAYGKKERLLDYPIGSLFARFVYAPIRSVDPYRVHVISFTQYLSVIRGFTIWEFVRSVHLNFPFFLKSVRNSISFTKDGLKSLMDKHKERRDRYALETGLSSLMLEKLDNLRARPLGHSMNDIFVETFRPIIKKVAWISSLSVLSIFGWILIFTALNHLFTDSVLGTASIVSVLGVITVGGLFYLFTKIGQVIEGYEDPLVKLSHKKASKIAKITKTKHVVMGHTHIVKQLPLPNGGKYMNSGTWVLFPGPWDNLQLQSRQFTFVTYSNGKLKLRKWDPFLKKITVPIILSQNRRL
jgi:UDP-2,3-diacylglucosamine pyrophosphatase LpxH